MKITGGFYVSQIKQLQERIFDKLLSDYGVDVSGAQGRILYVLWQEDNLNMSEIGRRTSLANNTLTIVINRMVDKRILTRTADVNNRRQVTISLTEYAKALQRNYEAVSDKMSEIFYSGFSDTEILEFENKLRRILSNLKDWKERGV